jgi:AraC-like DNA-binding protein
MSRIMMQARGETKTLTFGGRPPLQVSATSGWAGVPFEVHRLRGRKHIGESGPCAGEHGLMVVTDGGFETVVRGPRGSRHSTSSSGSMQFVAGDCLPYVEQIEGEAEVVAIDLTPAWLQYATVDPRLLGRSVPLLGRHTARALVAAMRDELARAGAGGRLYAESLSRSLLSVSCSHQPTRTNHESGRLTAPQRSRLESYVREHLERDLGLEELAGQVGLPPRRFSERFRRSFGTTPHRYVMQVRLLQGARLLAGGRHDIAETAVRVGFCSQSHFTAAFRRVFGETPARYARQRRVTSAV